MNERILGSLTMAAIGDAMGAATENLPFDKIRMEFGGPLEELVAPGKTAFAYGNKAGEVTDDFSQIYLISNNVVVNGGEIEKQVIVDSIIEWSNIPQYFNRFAGPTTRSAIEMYKNGLDEIKALPGAVTVDYASKATNGSAMKIAPAGLFNPGNYEKALKDAIIITKVTHDNSLAISGACAVALSVSESMKETATMDSIIEAGLLGAKKGEEEGKKNSRYVAGPNVYRRMELALEIANGSGTKSEKLLKLYEVVGSGLHISEAVPCAYGILALNKETPYQATIDAVNIGYDTDTIATIVGAMTGALVKEDNFKEKLETIEKANNMDLRGLASKIEELVK
ncbi:ADP-ribosylglycohydrolase family protein [Vagococcus fluvialis]|uniref:ADP-ribosylglycohydrolase family protein n=1 Tax=Vagococcus fluvialis TaxID=2738 RepID=UPI0037992F72